MLLRALSGVGRYTLSILPRGADTPVRPVQWQRDQATISASTVRRRLLYGYSLTFPAQRSPRECDLPSGKPLKSRGKSDLSIHKSEPGFLRPEDPRLEEESVTFSSRMLGPTRRGEPGHVSAGGRSSRPTARGPRRQVKKNLWRRGLACRHVCWRLAHWDVCCFATSPGCQFGDLRSLNFYFFVLESLEILSYFCILLKYYT